MNYIHVNILNSYWDNNLTEQKRKYQYSKDFISCDSIDAFEQSLFKTIMTDKGDGLELDIYSFGNNHYVDVVLLLGNVNEDEYSIDYLINFLNQYSEHQETLMEMDYSEYDTFVYLQFASEDFKSIIKELKEQGIDAKLISERRSTFERGAGDYFLAYLIGIASSKTVDALNKVKEKYNDHVREVQVGKLDIENIKREVSEITGINYDNLYMVAFEEKKQGEFKVQLRTRYENLYINTNSKGEIMSYSQEGLTQTRI